MLQYLICLQHQKGNIQREERASEELQGQKVFLV